MEEERMSTEFLMKNIANTQVSLRFSTNTVMKYKETQVLTRSHFKRIDYQAEYLSLCLQVFSLADIIGSLGGCLGLFFGFSCLKAAQALFRNLKLKM